MEDWKVGDFPIQFSEKLDLAGEESKEERQMEIIQDLKQKSAIDYPFPATPSFQKFHIPGMLFCFLGSILLLLTGCGSKGKSSPQPDSDSVDIRPTVIFARADHKPLYYYIETQGVTEPVRKINIQLNLSGFVRESALQDGKMVKKGDTLLALNDTEWQLAFQQAQTEYQKAKTGYDIEKSLRKGRADNADSAQTNYMLKVQFGLEQAEIARDKAKLDIQYAHVVAPFSGVLGTSQTFSPGQYVTAGTQLATLVDLSHVQVRLDVLEENIGRVKIGQPVQIIMDDSAKMVGNVTGISPLVNQQTKTGQVVALFNNPKHLLLPGMTVNARILTRSVEGTARVPRAAVLERENRLLVFELRGDEVNWVYVHPLAMNNQWAELKNKDIAPGDTIAVDRHFALSHKEKVTVKMEE